MRLINADDKLLRAELFTYIRDTGMETAINAIDKAPTIDAEEVVRCKDCKDSRVYGKTTQWLACESVMEGQATDPDGYCYLGERREESEVEE